MIRYWIGGIAVGVLLCPFIFSLKPKLRIYRVTSAKLSKPIRLLQVSDLHSNIYPKQQLAGMIREAKPDAILLTGDIVEDEKVPDVGMTADGFDILNLSHPVRKFLEAIRDIAPIYMVYGNHEHYLGEDGRLTDELSKLGVQLLKEESREVVLNGQRLTVSGIFDPYFYGKYKHIRGGYGQKVKDGNISSKEAYTDGIDAWRNAVANLPHDKGVLSVLLSHRPEEDDVYRKSGYDVVFSGHAHGGQVRIPFLLNGLYAPHQGLFPRRAGGIYRDGFVHVVSRGLQKKRAPRIFNRPELCLLQITPETR